MLHIRAWSSPGAGTTVTALARGAKKRKGLLVTRFLTLVLMFLVSAEPAYAYMGPGSGLAFLGSLFALIGAIAAGILGFIWYPLKRVLRAVRNRSDDDRD